MGMLLRAGAHGEELHAQALWQEEAKKKLIRCLYAACAVVHHGTLCGGEGFINLLDVSPAYRGLVRRGVD